MGNKPKPNFTPFGNKKAKKKSPGVLESLFTPAKKQTSRTHHDSVKGNKGNGGGKRR